MQIRRVYRMYMHDLIIVTDVEFFDCRTTRPQFIEVIHDNINKKYAYTYMIRIGLYLVID